MQSEAGGGRRSSPASSSFASSASTVSFSLLSPSSSVVDRRESLLEARPSSARLASTRKTTSSVSTTMQRPPVRTGSGSRVSALASEFRRAATIGRNASSSSRPTSRSRSRPSRPGTPSAVPSRSSTPVSKVETLENEDEELLAYISSSPLLPSTGLTTESIRASLPEWSRLAEELATSLDFPSPRNRERWTKQQSSRVFHYYLPVFFWIRSQIELKRKEGSSEPLVVGIQAPQGCGKTTLVAEMERLLASVGLKAASVSVDDFYLTFEGQQKVASENEGNPLLELRGNAGSHDLELGSRTLEALVKGDASGVVALPRYDKSKHGGRGDRADPSTWPRVSLPVDVVLFEGWMLGFRPVGAEAAAKVSTHLPASDEILKKYEGSWDRRCDSWLLIRATQGPQCVYRWRLEAERQLRASTGGKGMTDEQVADFVDRFLPAYEAYLPGSAELGPPGSKKGKVLVVGVEDDRSLSEAQPGPPAALK